MMLNEIDALLDDLLIRWWQWRKPFTVGSGFPKTVPACRQFRCSRQYDYENGAWDEDIENLQLSGVAHAVEQIDNPWKLALHENAINLVIGVDVVRYNRLPDDPYARAIIVAEARNMLLAELQEMGIA